MRPTEQNPIPAPAGAMRDELDSHPVIHDCWNQIGVEGNATCRELARYIHCRNCPVYSSAARQMLDRPLPGEYRQECARHYAQAKLAASVARLSVVLFRLAQEWFALPTAAFQEVAERRPLHTLPHRRRGLALGLVNVRGELLICVSAARLLGVGTDQNQDGNHAFRRLLVTIWEGQRLVLPVDEVHGIERFLAGEVKAPPATVARSLATCTTGILNWRDRTVGLLSPGEFFGALNRSLA